MSSTGEVEVPRAALRVNEACATLGISRSKIYEELAAGRLEARKAGSCTLIPMASINAWLNNLPTLPEAAKAA
jgi:excisionase family DNA binding protein